MKRIYLILCILFSFCMVNAKELDIMLENVSIADKSDTVTVSEPVINDNDEVISDIVFNQLDDFVVYAITIKNNDSSPYSIKSIADNNKNKNVGIEYSYSKEEIASNESAVINMTIKYSNELKNVDSIELNDIRIDVTFDDGKITLNPRTWDPIVLYILVGIISLVGLIISLKHLKKQYKALALIFVLIPVVIIGKAVFTLKIYFTNIEVIGTYDMYNVEINPNNNDLSSIMEVRSGDSVGTLGTPEKEGYTFVGWYDSNGNKVDENTPITSNLSIEARYTANKYTINYELDGATSNNTTEYTIEDEVTLTEPTKAGYTFTGWTGSNGNTPQKNVTITRGTTGNKSYTANFTPNTDTAYTVNHKYKNLDGTYETETEVLYGETDTFVEPSVKPKTGFVNPEKQQVKITGDGEASIDYIYNRAKVALTLLNPENIDTTFTLSEYDYETEITLTAKTIEHYTFAGWTNGQNANPLVFNLTSDTTVGPTYQLAQYTIKFDGQGGTNPSDYTRDYGAKIGTLPTTEREEYIFEGWFTATTGGAPITEDTQVDGDKTYYAHWSKSVAIADISPLNIELDKGQTTQITVTNVEEEYTFTSNDPSVATVDANGVVTGKSEGITTITIEGTRSHQTRTVNVAVDLVVFEITFDAQGGTGGTTVQKEENTSLGTLPTTEREGYIFEGWFTEAEGGTQISSDTQVTSDKTYYAHWSKSVAVATITPDSITLTRGQTTAITITNVEEEYTITSNDPSIVTVDNMGVVNALAKGTTTITVEGTRSHETRTINVTINPVMYDITFDAQGGSNGSTVSKEENVAIGTLPETEREGYIFDGWFTLAEGGDKISSTTTVTATTTYYAHWTKSITLANVSPELITLTRGQSGNITVTNVEETYTFTSGDEDIATVDSNGQVTSVAKGTTTITIEGTRSHQTKLVDVIVNPVMYEVTFDSQGGSSVAGVSIEENTAIGELSTPTKENQVFVGWFTDAEGGTKITSSTVIDGPKEYFAHWENAISLATISPESITITRGQTSTISVTNVGEEYIFTSSDTDKVTVDENGVVTGVAKGTATITIEGTTSHTTRTITVTVNPVMYDITYDAQGGTGGTTVSKEENTTLGTLPTTERENYLFDGWFTLEEGGDEISSTTTVSGEKTYYAHWSKSVALANVSPESITLTRGNTQTITLTNVEEEYTFTSSDTSKVTVDENGLVTGVAKGTATITIEGTRSHATKTVDVTVNPIMYDVTFNAQGGTGGTTVSKEENTTLGTLPTTEQEGYIFEGWFTEAEDGTQIDSDTLVTGETTYFAHWSKSVALANVSPTSITLDREETATITVTNVDETYTFTSSNSEIATVDQNGLVTAIAKGSVTITIEGKRSHATKTVTVSIDAIMYDITFNAQGGTGSTTVSKEENTTLGALPTTEQEGYIFEGWFTEAEGGTKISSDTLVTGETTYFAHWSKSVALANVSPESITLTRGETATITVTNVEETYTFTSSDPTKVTVDENGLVTSVAKGTAIITIEGTKSHATKTVSVTVNPIMYDITFNAQGGTGSTTVSKEENVAIGTLPTTEQEGYIFDGWFTEAEGGDEISSTTTVTGETTYYAHWSKSVALANISPASVTVTRGQSANIIVTNVDETYTFTSSDESVATVDENGQILTVAKGTTTITIEGTRSHATKTVDVKVNPVMYTVTFNSQGGSNVGDASIEENTAIGELSTPTKENQVFVGWFTEAEGGTKITSSTVIDGPKEYFAHWGNAISLATISPDSITVTRTQTGLITVTNVGETYTFTSENDAIATVNSEGIVTGVAKGTTTITVEGTTSHTTKTVNVTVNPIMYTITYDPQGGDNGQNVDIEENTTLGTLPTTEREDYLFDGWFTDPTNGTPIDSDTLVTGDDTYYAHWSKSVALANVSPESITLTRGNTQTITLTNVDETYTFTSNDPSKATVDANGLVTGVAKGTATITIEGTKSHATKTVSVTVNPIMYEVSYNTHGGTSVASQEKEENVAIGSLPTTEKADYIFNGWFTAASGGLEVKSDYVVTGPTTLHAYWSKSITLASVSPESITLTRGETQTITVTNVEEEYTFTSSDPSKATVDQNGLVTAVAKGTATITIEGTRSHETKTVDVTVNPIMYEITFDSQGGTNGSTSEMEENTPLGTLPTTERTGCIFEGWFTEATGGEQISASTLVTGEKTYYAHWTKTVALAEVSPASITLIRGQSTNITVTNVDEAYTFTSGNDNVATVDANGIVNSVAKGTTTITIEGTKSHATKVINVTINPIMYTVEFDSRGGSNVADASIEENTAIGPLPEPIKTNYTFDGWYTAPTSGTQVTSSYVVNSTTILYAHWTPDGVICKKATSLHTETCIQTGSTGCKGAGYAQDATITYGQLPTTIALMPGDAYDCDVNADNTFDSTYERFYYLRTNGSNAVFISAYNYEGTEPGNKNIYLYDDAVSMLPDATDWTNVATTYSDKAARFPSQADLESACNAQGLTANGSLDSCQFLLENTKFSSEDLGRTAVWIEYSGSGSHTRYMSTNRNIITVDADSKSAARPVIEIELSKVERNEAPTKILVHFDAHGGEAVADMEVDYNTAIGTLPTTSQVGYTFDGWFTAGTGGTQVTPTTVITEEVTFHAHWSSTTGVAQIGQTTYETLNEAIEAVPDNTETTILILDDITITSKETISSSKNIVLDLQGHNINNSSQSTGTVFENNGTLRITDSGTDGSITGGGKNNSNQLPVLVNKAGGTVYIEGGTISSTVSQVVDNYGTMTMTGGKITIGNVDQGILNNNAGAIFNISGGTIIADIAGSRKQAIYNNGGTVNLSGDAILSSLSTNRATIQNETSTSVFNMSGGTVISGNKNCDSGAFNNKGTGVITGGTIISASTKSGGYGGIQNTGTLTIGTQGGNIDTTNPVIQGKLYGVSSTKNYSFYDGIIKGITAAVNDQNKITGKESVPFLNGTETIDSDTYYTLTYDTSSSASTTYRISLNAKGGTVSPTYVDIPIGDPVGTLLPTPTNGVYTFDGWYEDEQYNTLVTSSTTPTENTEYFAKWSYTPSNSIENFNATNDVMAEYYDHISTWKNNSSTFQSNMKSNFDNYNCQCKDGTCTSSGTVSCDKPKGYDTGTNAALNVYLSDESTKTKGASVSYTNSGSGVIYNMIPGQVYYWELASDSNVYGLVKASDDGNRRILNTEGVGNTRDLGGLRVDANGDGTADGTLKYGILFRGEKIGTSSAGKTILQNLGVNEEVDLRGSSEIGSGELTIPTFKNRELKHYQIDDATHHDYYVMDRAVVKEVIQDITNNNKKIYFHCRIGADRTGTLAYILEGLLNVMEEDRLRDYELSFFSGLVNRHRFYNYDANSSVSKDQKFVYMYDLYDTNTKIYNWFIDGAADQTERDSDIALINSFRTKMIQ